MSVLDRFAYTCLDAAARRWPDELSETMSREWNAELAAIRVDPALGLFARSRRMIAFAMSLACSSAVEADGSAALDWRGRVSGIGRALSSLAGVVGVALLAAALFNVVHETYYRIQDFAPAAFGPVTDVALLAVAVTSMSWIGVVAARRGAFAAAGRSATVAAVIYTVPLGLAMYGFLLAGNRVRLNPFMGWIDIAPGMAAWTVLTALAVGLATRLVRSGRRCIGLWTAIAIATVALDIAAFCGSIHAATSLGLGFGSAPAWFPLSLAPGGTVSFGHLFADGTATFGDISVSGSAFRASDVLLGNVSSLVGPLLLCTAFVVAYAMRAASALEATPVETADAEPAHGNRIASAVAAVTGLASLAIWVFLSAFADTSDPNYQAVALALRIVAIVLIVSSAVVVMAGRGPVTGPAVGTFVILLVADGAAGQGHRHGVLTATTLVAVTGATLYAAWRSSRALAGPGMTNTSTRRALVATAVLCVLVAPMATAPSGSLPREASALGYVLAGLPWLIAVTAALASREQRLGLTEIVVAVVLPLALSLSFASGAVARAMYWPHSSFFIQAPLGVLAVAVARWDTSGNRVRLAAAWLAAVAAAAVLSLPICEALGQSGDLVGAALDRIANNTNVFGFGFSGNVGGQIALGLALGVLAARWTVRPAKAIRSQRRGSWHRRTARSA